MDSIKQLAKHFREVHFGGNWTTVNMKDTLDDKLGNKPPLRFTT